MRVKVWDKFVWDDVGRLCVGKSYKKISERIKKDHPEWNYYKTLFSLYPWSNPPPTLSNNYPNTIRPLAIGMKSFRGEKPCWLCWLSRFSLTSSDYVL